MQQPGLSFCALSWMFYDFTDDISVNGLPLIYCSNPS